MQPSNEASREPPKSVSYLRLNNIQGKSQPFVKFFIYHTVPKNPEKAFPETLKQFFLCTGNLRKN